MTKQVSHGVLNHKKKSGRRVNFYHFLVWLLVSLLLISGFVWNVLQMQPSIEATHTDTAISQYRDGVNQLHIQWLWKGKPGVITIFDANGLSKGRNSQQFLMNRQGWPKTIKGREDELACGVLWEVLQSSKNLTLAFERVNASDERSRILGQGGFFEVGVCQYFKNDKPLFYYDLSTGIVKKGAFESS